ncbi:MAG TPA: galactokinase family protein [Thermomicrobiales bacterium]|nr:galactokinase family protein [Thermomicrobiales bacterium]
MDAALTSFAHAGKQVFGQQWQPSRVAIAPGRVELLGNHVDYNGGLVLAGAIDRVIHAVGGRADVDEDMLLLHAPDVSPSIAEVSISHPVIEDPEAPTTPGDYLAGIVQALREARVPARGGQAIVVAGDVPVGFGMSSSAALCVSLTLLVAAAPLEDASIVTVARHAEHLTGAPVGAMDQSASVAGGVILFDGSTNDVVQLDPDLGDHVFAVADSGVHHALNESQYPQRVRESQEALELLRANAGVDIQFLGELTPEQWGAIVAGDPYWLSPTPRKRVQHVVSEVERVREGVKAIQSGDWPRFGELMTASGRSSAEEYEISHPAVEELVSLLRDQPGVLGARMMGGGEGGPALALLRRDAVESVREALTREFFDPHHMDAVAAFEICSFGPGARSMDLP